MVQALHRVLELLTSDRPAPASLPDSPVHRSSSDPEVKVSTAIRSRLSVSLDDTGVGRVVCCLTPAHPALRSFLWEAARCHQRDRRAICLAALGLCLTLWRACRRRADAPERFPEARVLVLWHLLFRLAAFPDGAGLLSRCLTKFGQTDSIGGVVLGPCRGAVCSADGPARNPNVYPPVCTSV